MDVEFAKQLALETELTYVESMQLIDWLYGRNELYTAKRLYNEQGYGYFKYYVNILKSLP